MVVRDNPETFLDFVPWKAMSTERSMVLQGDGVGVIVSKMTSILEAQRAR
jgi:hypothetical protein